MRLWDKTRQGLRELLECSKFSVSHYYFHHKLSYNYSHFTGHSHLSRLLHFCACPLTHVLVHFLTTPGMDCSLMGHMLWRNLACAFWKLGWLLLPPSLRGSFSNPTAAHQPSVGDLLLPGVSGNPHWPFQHQGGPEHLEISTGFPRSQGSDTGNGPRMVLGVTGRSGAVQRGCIPLPTCPAGTIMMSKNGGGCQRAEATDTAWVDRPGRHSLPVRRRAEHFDL